MAKGATSSYHVAMGTPRVQPRPRSRNHAEPLDERWEGERAQPRVGGSPGDHRFGGRDKRFDALAAAVGGSVWLAGPDGTIAEDSPSWQVYTGQSADETVGFPWLDAVHPDDFGRARDFWAESVADGTTLCIEVRLRHRDEWNWARVRAVAMCSPSGSVTGWVGTAVDIERAHDNGIRVRVLAERLVRAEEEERARISEVLHDDLQQRLYGIRMQVSLLQNALPGGFRGDDLASALDHLDDCVDRSIAVTRGLATVLSPDLGQTGDLRPAVQDLAAMMQARHGIEVEVVGPDEFVISDEVPRRLTYQIVSELLFNAVKHAQIDRARVELRVGDRHREIEIADSGRGFDTGERSLRGGPGLGLRRARERAEALGGRLLVQSSPGTGTRVTLRWPLVSDV